VLPPTLCLLAVFVSQIEDKASIIPLVAGMRREVQNLIAEVSGSLLKLMCVAYIEMWGDWDGCSSKGLVD
jgi:hypothetical protein